MLFFIIACVWSSFVISFVATWLVRRFAVRLGLVDEPGDRKIHTVPTPLGGGIGIWFGVVVPLLAVQLSAWVITRTGQSPAWIPREVSVHLDGVVHRSSQLWLILAGATILSLLGLLDDLRNLPWKRRLLVQVVVAGGLVAGGVRATVFLPVPWLGAVLSGLWILVLVNSFNFLDNMDGLSAGIALVSSSILAAVMLTSTGEPRWLVAGVLLVVAGSLIGFLCFNKPPASIFMGDSGSYFIGSLMSTMTLVATYYSNNGSRHVILAPLCILAVPLYDFASVMIIRVREGRSPFHGDKSHFSHRLVELGLSRGHTVLTICLATFTTGLGALLLYKADGWTEAMLVVLLIASVLATVAILETAGRRRRSNE